MFVINSLILTIASVELICENIANGCLFIFFADFYQHFINKNVWQIFLKVNYKRVFVWTQKRSYKRL